MKTKQNKADNEDAFQQLKQEIETKIINLSPQNNIKYNPRALHLIEKHKLGLIAYKTQEYQQESTNIKIMKKNNCLIANNNCFKVGSGVFKSNFECGSLGGVEMIGSNIYRMCLEKESNSLRGNTWFYFSVEGLKGQAQFVIDGFRKKSSLYNEGMKICYRNSKEMKWKRGGTQICYQKDDNDAQNSTFHLKFNFHFKSDQASVTEFAYCFPYGLTQLKIFIQSLRTNATIQTLACSSQGRDIPLLNIGNMSSKEVIILSARVHPGQTVSSFIMSGFIKQLVSDNQHSKFLRDKFLFKLVPMINVDGVYHGNLRFSANGVDLNRRWKQPSENYHPEIYYFKQMILKEQRQKQVKMFIDMHGHSRKKNVFFYGCCQESKTGQSSYKSKLFPYLMSNIHESYSFKDCSFKIQPQKEGTARISLWKEVKINEIYTLEASFCGNEKGLNYLSPDLQKIGRKLCEGIALYFYGNSQVMPEHLRQGIAYRQKLVSQFMNNKQLQETGNEDDSGSDSEPQAGEKPIVIKMNDNDTNREIKVRKSQLNSRNKSRVIKPIEYPEGSSYKIEEFNDKLQDKNTLTYLQEQQLQNLQINFHGKPQNDGRYKRPRVYSAITQSNYRKIPIVINKQKQQDSIIPGVKLTSQRERLTTSVQNAQYLRIKKFVEKNANKSSARIQPEIVQSSIKVQKHYQKYWGLKVSQKSVVPRFFTHNKYKHIDKKNNTSRNKINRVQIMSNSNVICKGTRIGF